MMTSRFSTGTEACVRGKQIPYLAGKNNESLPCSSPRDIDCCWYAFASLTAFCSWRASRVRLEQAHAKL
jgi:hypothetical protein